MVAGAVNPPNIDLANEDLIRSHLQAVWLAETGVKLGSSVCDVIDREKAESLPLTLAKSNSKWVPTGHVTETRRRGLGILAMLESDLTGQAAPWHTDTWLDSAVNSAERRLNGAFDRWRSLFRATDRADADRKRRSWKNAAASEKERREAKSRYDEAFHPTGICSLAAGRP